MPKSTTRKRTLSPDYLVEIVAASPEGFFHKSELENPKLGLPDPHEVEELIAAALETADIGVTADFIYDPTRLTPEEVRERSNRYKGSIPQLRNDGSIVTRSIEERMRFRQKQLKDLDDPAFDRIVAAFDGTEGYLQEDEVLTESGDEGALAILEEENIIRRQQDLVYDPLRISRTSVESVLQKRMVEPVREKIMALLRSKPGHTAPRVELVEQFGSRYLQLAMNEGGFSTFPVATPLGDAVWIRLTDADADAAKQIALEAVKPKDEDWQAALEFCEQYETVGDDPVEADSIQEAVEIMSLPAHVAAKRLGIRMNTMTTAITTRRIAAFVDPEGQTRVPRGEIELIEADNRRRRTIEDLEVIRLHELKIVFSEIDPHELQHRLRRTRKGRHQRNENGYRWGEIRNVLFDKPISLTEFHTLYRERRSEWAQTEEDRKVEQRRKRDEKRTRERSRRDEERRQRDELRARLLAAFPTWQHEGRADQRIVFHVGPPNSGKTHDALNTLAAAETGWYLAPLRLLAFEIFDRLNRRGVRCNLLTGEEFIPVDGATITAATIEMFNPTRSGDVVVIDEAQMLADPDRGWAWTRALMEARAPEIQVIGPTHARGLVERLAAAAAIPLEVVEHQRLAPIQVAQKSWTLHTLPPRTILVAFSRQTVLRLKTELENHGRTVSVIYGNLPPEVRRKQADRFAFGETEICVATDAVGMGLNLPADNVCFYEMEKFDGKSVRPLTPSEVHQIGGRAGRFGMSAAGTVNATSRGALKLLRTLFSYQPDELIKARVAPEVADLELIPGSLAHRFAQWRELQSIPDSLRDVIEPADIDERIALSQRLTDREVEQLGLAAAVQLVNAPTRESSREYWYACTRSILKGRPMPLPPEAPEEIIDTTDLDATETAISFADIYLWLSHRKEFGMYGPDEPLVRQMRANWSAQIDLALLRRIDTSAKCLNCGNKLPLGHRYSICDACHYARTGWY